MNKNDLNAVEVSIGQTNDRWFNDYHLKQYNNPHRSTIKYFEWLNSKISLKVVN